MALLQIDPHVQMTFAEIADAAVTLGIMKIRLKIAGNKEEILGRLRRLDGVLEAEALPGEDPDVLEARVAAARGADGGKTLDRLFRALADSGLPVRMMREEQENLEEVFLRVVSS